MDIDYERSSSKDEIKEDEDFQILNEEPSKKTKKRKESKEKEEPNSKTPNHWEDMWDTIETMRSEKLAPVDTMGFLKFRINFVFKRFLISLLKLSNSCGSFSF